MKPAMKSLPPSFMQKAKSLLQSPTSKRVQRFMDKNIYKQSNIETKHVNTTRAEQKEQSESCQEFTNKTRTSGTVFG